MNVDECYSLRIYSFQLECCHNFNYFMKQHAEVMQKMPMPLTCIIYLFFGTDAFLLRDCNFKISNFHELELNLRIGVGCVLTMSISCGLFFPLQALRY